MGHNSVVSGDPESTRIPWVDGLSTGLLDFGASQFQAIRYTENPKLRKVVACSVLENLLFSFRRPYIFRSYSELINKK